MKEPPTKLQLYEILEHETRSRKGQLIHLAGDCYAARVDGEVRLAIALKESGETKKMWVGSPEPMTRLLTGQYRFVDTGDTVSTRVDRVLIALIHRPTKTIMLIPLYEVWQVIVAKARANRSALEWSFNVEMIGYRKFVVKQDPYLPAIPVANVGSLDHAVALLDQPLPPAV